MKRNLLFLIAALTGILGATSCNNRPHPETTRGKNTEKLLSSTPVATKPVSSYPDTLVIETVAAVFYHPDSLQLRKAEALAGKDLHETAMHEYFYQMRNARIVIKKTHPGIRIIDANHVRYLLFRKKRAPAVLVDLDTKNDLCGLFLFDQKQDPHFSDMMNIDTELYRYFSK